MLLVVSGWGSQSVGLRARREETASDSYELVDRVSARGMQLGTTLIVGTSGIGPSRVGVI